MRVSALNIFPLKSARGISLNEARVDAFGLAGDRRWMVTEPSGKFVTQRDLPQLAQISAYADDNGLTLRMGSDEPLLAPATPDRRRQDVIIWDSTVNAAVADEEINQTISRWMQRPLQLVHFDEVSRRTASVNWVGEETPVAFGDGYQVLITNTASLNALNENMAAHGETTVGMERFRANIVLEHDVAWAEDGWEAVKIGDILFRLVKPCARCIMTTQDQSTGSRDIASPMPAMGRMRMSADRSVPGPLFGWNAVPVGHGTIKVGDEAQSVGAKEPWAIKKR